jgi:transcriptional regulator with XRE-family HTH domain
VADLGYVVARNVRAERARLGLHQRDLAARLGWVQVTVSALETGKRAVTIGEMPALCDALGVTLADLVRGADPDDLRKMGL